jgi:hypothetical protein
MCGGHPCFSRPKHTAVPRYSHDLPRSARGFVAHPSVEGFGVLLLDGECLYNEVTMCMVGWTGGEPKTPVAPVLMHKVSRDGIRVSENNSSRILGE